MCWRAAVPRCGTGWVRAPPSGPSFCALLALVCAWGNSEGVCTPQRHPTGVGIGLGLARWFQGVDLVRCAGCVTGCSAPQCCFGSKIWLAGAFSGVVVFCLGARGAPTGRAGLCDCGLVFGHCLSASSKCGAESVGLVWTALGCSRHSMQCSVLSVVYVGDHNWSPQHGCLVHCGPGDL